MIYYIFYELIFNHFKDKDWYLIKALNVFQYVTFRTAYASITAMLISLLFGGRLIEALRKWNVGQQIREEGPQGHLVKRGTPTMGGVLMVGSVLISTLLWARLNGVYIWTAMMATLGFAAIGFVDDYSKMAKQRSLGLTGRQKLLAQLLIAVGVWAVLLFRRSTGPVISPGTFCFRS
jgi:phospho-N-acetylmuramoyl-pentapeptide-transferase